MLAHISSSKIKINLIEKDKIDILANEELLTTAISNLIINAIKYSLSKQIDIILSKNKTNIKIEVKDYGIGIKKEDSKRIFEKFYRVDKARSREKGGIL